MDFSVSHYRPGQALLGFQEVQAPRISRQLSHEDGKVVGPTYRFVPILCTVQWVTLHLQGINVNSPANFCVDSPITIVIKIS